MCSWSHAVVALGSRRQWCRRSRSDRLWFDRVTGHKIERVENADVGETCRIVDLPGQRGVLGPEETETARLTGKKEEQKSYMSFSGYVGGHKSENVRARRVRHPELLVERAVRGMIPHNRLGRSVYRKLKVYRGNSHPHAAQQPQPVKLQKS